MHLGLLALFHSLLDRGHALAARVAPFALAGALVVIGCSCGESIPPAAAVTPPPDADPSVLSARQIDGDWRWSLVVEEDGVRQIEVERWHLEARAGSIRGHYERTVTFLAASGVPFRCSQTLGYQLHTIYQIEGSYLGRTLELVERSYQTAPSPCEPGERRLGSYRGELRDGSLVLAWPGGEQTLAPEPGPVSRPVAPSPARTAPPTSAAGSWRWQSRTRGDEIRVEIEEWDLSENPTGAIRGAVTRTITVFDPAGRRFECNGDTFYRYVDRYEVRGQRTGTEITLRETHVAPTPHACLTRTARHLDVATGALAGEYLVLTWRGNRRQVLHRPQ